MTDSERITRLELQVAMLTEICKVSVSAGDKHLTRTERQNEFLRSMVLLLAIGMKNDSASMRAFGEQVRAELTGERT